MQYMAYVRDGFDLNETERLIHTLGGQDAYIAKHGSGQIIFDASERVAERVRSERCIVSVIEHVVSRGSFASHHASISADEGF